MKERVCKRERESVAKHEQGEAASAAFGSETCMLERARHFLFVLLASASVASVASVCLRSQQGRSV